MMFEMLTNCLSISGIWPSSNDKYNTGLMLSVEREYSAVWKLGIWGSILCAHSTARQLNRPAYPFSGEEPLCT